MKTSMIFDLGVSFGIACAGVLCLTIAVLLALNAWDRRRAARGDSPVPARHAEPQGPLRTQ